VWQAESVNAAGEGALRRQRYGAARQQRSAQVAGAQCRAVQDGEEPSKRVAGRQGSVYAAAPRVPRSRQAANQRLGGASYAEQAFNSGRWHVGSACSAYGARCAVASAVRTASAVRSADPVYVQRIRKRRGAAHVAAIQ